MKHYIGLILVLISAYTTAQEVLNVGYAPDTVYVGDVVSIKYMLSEVPSADVNFDFESVKNIAFDTSIVGSKEYLDIELLPADGYNTSGRTAILKAGQAKEVTLKIGVFDVGAFVLPIPTSNGNRLSMDLITLPINDVNNEANNAPIEGIRDIIEEKNNWTDYAYIGYILLALGIAYLLYRYFNRKKPEEKIEEVSVEKELNIPIIDPVVEASEALQYLKDNEMWKQEDQKAFHSELTFVVRRYLQRTTDVQALEQTTDETRKGLQHSKISQAWQDKLMAILQISDIVKFAKGKSGEELNLSYLNEAIQFINQEKSNVS